MHAVNFEGIPGLQHIGTLYPVVTFFRAACTPSEWQRLEHVEGARDAMLVYMMPVDPLPASPIDRVTVDLFTHLIGMCARGDTLYMQPATFRRLIVNFTRPFQIELQTQGYRSAFPTLLVNDLEVDIIEHFPYPAQCGKVVLLPNDLLLRLS